MFRSSKKSISERVEAIFHAGKQAFSGLITNITEEVTQTYLKPGIRDFRISAYWPRSLGIRKRENKKFLVLGVFESLSLFCS